MCPVKCTMQQKMASVLPAAGTTALADALRRRAALRSLWYSAERLESPSHARVPLVPLVVLASNKITLTTRRASNSASFYTIVKVR